MQIMFLIGYADEALGQSLGWKLAREVGIPITSKTTALANVVSSAAAIRPEVLLLEGDGRFGRALRHLPDIRKASPGTRSLLLYETSTLNLTIEAIKQGASGCLNKSSEPSLYAKAIRAVHAGETWFGRLALLQALQSKIRVPPASQRLMDEGMLTPREEEILRLIGSGLTNKEIGRRLDISDKTVKTHLHHIYVKLNKSGRYKAFLSHPETRPGLNRTLMSAAFNGRAAQPIP
jgi:DNA-binding NarL/FixJ family response regulator